MKTRPRGDLAILAVLESGPLHGYAIFETISTYQTDLIRKVAHLYPKLQVLKEEGRVVSREVKNGEDVRVVYTITPSGLTYLTELRNDLEAFQWVCNPVVQSHTGKDEPRRPRIGAPPFPPR